jgi:hypothetical protein
VNDSAPWEWWSTTNPNSATSLLTNPDMSPEKAKTFIDTIIAYAAPRMMCALELSGSICLTSGVDSQDELTSSFVILYPNPTKDVTTIHSSNMMNRVEVINMMGSVVYSAASLQTNRHILNEKFASGIYLVNIYTDKGTVVEKLIVE